MESSTSPLPQTFCRPSAIWFSGRSKTQGKPERSCCRSSINSASPSSTKSPSKMQPTRRLASNSPQFTSIWLDSMPSVRSANGSPMQIRFTLVRMEALCLGYSSNGTTSRTPPKGTSVVWSPTSAKICSKPVSRTFRKNSLTWKPMSKQNEIGYSRSSIRTNKKRQQGRICASRFGTRNNVLSS